MSPKAVPNGSVSLYLSPYYRYLLDLLMEDVGYESRSEFVSAMLTCLFVKQGLWNRRKSLPTKEALRRSSKLRKLKSMLDLLESSKEGDSSIFDGLAEELVKGRQRRTPVR